MLEKAIEQLRKQNRRVVLQCHGGVKANLKLDDILYFERDKRVTYVVTTEKEYTVDDKIPEIEERIASDDFVRCHTSFLVNFSCVEGMHEERNCCWRTGKRWMSAEVTGKRRKMPMWNG